jgi:hypothetical protein
MSHRDLILRRRKRFIRCQQQIDGKVLRGTPGLLTDPKACNRSIFNGLDPFVGLKIVGFEGGEPKPPKCNVFSCMLQKTAASWNKGKRPINELDPRNSSGAEVAAHFGVILEAGLEAYRV